MRSEMNYSNFNVIFPTKAPCLPFCSTGMDLPSALSTHSISFI